MYCEEAPERLHQTFQISLYSEDNGTVMFFWSTRITSMHITSTRKPPGWGRALFVFETLPSLFSLVSEISVGFSYNFRPTWNFLPFFFSPFNILIYLPYPTYALLSQIDSTFQLKDEVSTQHPLAPLPNTFSYSFTLCSPTLCLIGIIFSPKNRITYPLNIRSLLIYVDRKRWRLNLACISQNGWAPHIKH